MVWIRSLLSIRQTEVRLFEHVCNHSLEAHFSPILRGIDPTDAIIHQFFDFPGNDHSAAAAEPTRFQNSNPDRFLNEPCPNLTLKWCGVGWAIVSTVLAATQVPMMYVTRVRVGVSAHGGSASRAATFASWTSLRIARDRVQWSGDEPPLPPAKAPSKVAVPPAKVPSKVAAAPATAAAAASPTAAGGASATPSEWTFSQNVSAEEVCAH